MKPLDLLESIIFLTHCTLINSSHVSDNAAPRAFWKVHWLIVNQSWHEKGQDKIQAGSIFLSESSSRKSWASPETKLLLRKKESRRRKPTFSIPFCILPSFVNSFNSHKNTVRGTSLVVQWLCTPNAEGPDLIPDWGTMPQLRVYMP